jgi:hypothetical protein
LMYMDGNLRSQQTSLAHLVQATIDELISVREFLDNAGTNIFSCREGDYTIWVRLWVISAGGSISPWDVEV